MNGAVLDGRRRRIRKKKREKSCGKDRARSSAKKTESQRVLKDNAKFMVTDSLDIFEASIVKAMEQVKNKVGALGDITTSEAIMTEECVKKLFVHSLHGSKTVLSEVFPSS